MLPSKQRLSRQQATDLLKDPELKVVFNRLGTLKYHFDTSAYQDQFNSVRPALTVVTSSKNQKRAVLRNKLRRQIYSLALQYKDFSFIGMFYVSKNSYDMSYSDIKRYFYELLQKIG
jgi:ribonuclease P protein component